MTELLVTLPAEPEWRPVVDETLPDDLTITYLDDFDDAARRSAIRSADLLLSWNPHRELTDDELREAGDAELMQLMSAGADHVEFDKLPEGLTVACNAGAYAEPVAEHVLAMALALARRLRNEHENLREGEFNQRRVNKTLRGANLGIVGFGGIGREVAHLFRTLDVDVYAINTTGTTDREVAWCGTLDELEVVLEAADLLVLSLPLTDETEGLLGADELARMRDDAILVNVARGEHIDQEALYEHLESHPEFQAGLEAWWVEPFRDGEFRVDYPLLDLPNVLGAPHNSGVVPGTLERGIRRAAERIRAYLECGRIDDIVEPS
jgi:glycerate dehydrogenase